MEEKEIVSQIQNLMGVKPIVYLKFCAEEKFAQDVLDGNIYCNTVKYFRDLEKNSGEHGQGDQNELVLTMQSQKIAVFDYETGEFVAGFSEGKLHFQYKNDSLIPIACFVGIPLDKMKINEADENHAVFSFPFTEEEFATLASKFGPYCVMISGRELENRIKEVCRNCKFEYIFDEVKYCPANQLERIKAYADCDATRFLYKNEDFSYQKEYRLAVGIEIPEDHFFRIGKLKDAALLKATNLKNIALGIQYKSENI